MKRLPLAAGEKVFSGGDAGDAFYIVYQGKVEVRLKRMLFMTKAVAPQRDRRLRRADPALHPAGHAA